ncbi:MAG: hypothetical protein IJX36_04905 [Thermoguttaceae bacterium]|nr:hypothetical protein [Thermoguttaceae bacterium]MBQ8363252.1 hypothetical protein [Thermoguttaceae bacterium]MBQ9128982.1 hypothetical protein [Thermoguttaceae bacterium]
MQIFNRTLTLPQREKSEKLRRFDRERLEAHLAVAQYGSFRLTDAIRPSFDLAIVPEEGWRFDRYVDPETGAGVPVAIAAVSREKLFDVFFALLDGIGATVDVVVESSHRQNGTRDSATREGVDAPVLKSVFCDYEDPLLNDGCLGVAALDAEQPLEIQFDEHKLITVYGDDLSAAVATFRQFRVPRKPTMRFLNEAEHIHASRQSYWRAFDALKFDLGAE